MNKKRREKVESIYDQLNILTMELEEIIDEEEEAFENTPEGYKILKKEKKWKSTSLKWEML